MLQVATLVGANWLFLLTDVDNLYTSNPASNPDAKPIFEVHDIMALQVCHGADSMILMKPNRVCLPIGVTLFGNCHW